MTGKNHVTISVATQEIFDTNKHLFLPQTMKNELWKDYLHTVKTKNAKSTANIC